MSSCGPDRVRWSPGCARGFGPAPPPWTVWLAAGTLRLWGWPPCALRRRRSVLEGARRFVPGGGMPAVGLCPTERGPSSAPNNNTTTREMAPIAAAAGHVSATKGAVGEHPPPGRGDPSLCSRCVRSRASQSSRRTWMPRLRRRCYVGSSRECQRRIGSRPPPSPCRPR